MLSLTNKFKLKEDQYESIAMDICTEVRNLINEKYNEEVIIKTIDSILDDLSGKDEDLKTAIQREMKRCYPYIKWNFNVEASETTCPC